MQYFTCVLCIIFPAEFLVPSTFLTIIGFASFLLLLVAMDSSRNLPCAPLSIKAVVSTFFRFESRIWMTRLSSSFDHTITCHSLRSSISEKWRVFSLIEYPPTENPLLLRLHRSVSL